jgi:hypothetical protein
MEVVLRTELGGRWSGAVQAKLRKLLVRQR